MGLIEVVIRVLSDRLRTGVAIGRGCQRHNPDFVSIAVRTVGQGQKPLTIGKPILGTIAKTLARDDLLVSAAVR